MDNRPLISAVINYCHVDDPDLFRRSLKSIVGFADEIVVIDMTKGQGGQIAASFGAKVYSHKYLKVVEPVRNFGLSKTTGKWIILLDPDEILTKALKRELLKITRRLDVDYVKIPRKNIIFGKWIRHANCWPDYLIRFFKKGSVIWRKEIHSQPITKGNGITLLDSDKLSIKHFNYTTISHYLEHAMRYAKRQAEELIHQDYRLKTSDFILKPIQEFNSRFFAGEGFKDGIHGLVFCLLQSFAILLIYVKIWEKQGFQDKSLPKESFVSASQEATYEYSYWFTRYFHREYVANIFSRGLISLRHLFNRLTKNL